MPRRFYTAKDLVDMGLFKSTGMIYKLRSAGRLPITVTTFPGRRGILFAAEDLETYLKMAVKE